MNSQLTHIWTTFKQTRDPKLLEQLVHNYLPLVTKQAKKLKARFPQSVEISDLLQEGTIGLMQAIMAYDLNRGKSFEVFAPNRIRGSILDASRRADWMPRATRKNYKRLEASVEKLNIQLKRKPKYSELAKDLNISVDELKLWLSRLPPSITDFSTCFVNKGDKTQSVDDVIPSKWTQPDENVEYCDLKLQLMRGLTSRERIMLNMHLEGQRNVDVAKAVGVSESCISILKGPLLKRLQERLVKLIPNIIKGT